MTGPSARVTRVPARNPEGAPRPALALRLDDGRGHRGWGEASPLEGYSPDDLPAAEAALAAWGREWNGDAEASLAAGIRFGGGLLSAVPSAACAVEVALLDLLARARGESLHVLLLDGLDAVRPVGPVPVCALASLPGVDRPGAPTAAPDIASFEAVKFKLAGEAPFEPQLEALRSVREAFPDHAIRVDVNGGWSLSTAPERLERLVSIRPEFVEQPVPAADLALLESPVPLAADESLRRPGARQALLESESVGVFVLKPMVLGGLTVCAELASEAFRRGRRAIVSHTFGGPVAHAAAAELALALAAADPRLPAIAAGLQAGPRIVPTGSPGHGAEGCS